MGDWAARSNTAGKLPKVRAKNFPRWSLMGSQVQHRGGAAQNKPEDITARKLMGGKAQHRGGAAQNKPESITARKLLGSTRARSVPAAQSTSKKLPAREVNGQPSPAPRRSCPKQAERHHREEVYWAAQSSTAEELPKTSRKTPPRGSLMGSQVQHRGAAAQNKPESITARKLLGSKGQHRGGAAQNKPENTTAREFNGQHSPAPRQSCPKQARRHHREGS